MTIFREESMLLIAMHSLLFARHLTATSPFRVMAKICYHIDLKMSSTNYNLTKDIQLIVSKDIWGKK